jgi:pyruvate dehydrogenase (quinone)
MTIAQLIVDTLIRFRGCSHYSELISTAGQMPRVLQTAMQHAVGQGGVAVIVVSGDVAFQPVEQSNLRHDLLVNRPVIRPSNADLGRLAALIDEHEKITLLCGSGCRDAHEEIISLCETLKSPVVTALRGKQYVEYENPFDVGLTGLIGFESGRLAMERCEVLLMLGTDFPYQ